jgi:hypothetical protein
LFFIDIVFKGKISNILLSLLEFFSVDFFGFESSFSGYSIHGRVDIVIIADSNITKMRLVGNWSVRINTNEVSIVLLSNFINDSLIGFNKDALRSDIFDKELIEQVELFVFNVDSSILDKEIDLIDSCVGSTEEFLSNLVTVQKGSISVIKLDLLNCIDSRF